MTVSARTPTTKKTDSYETWQIEQLIDAKVAAAIEAYDAEQWGKDDERKPGSIPTYVNKKTARGNLAWSVGRFVVTAVVLLIIGTVYQLFVNLISSGAVR